MRLVLFVLFILQMAACRHTQQEEIFSYQLPEVTIYAKRTPSNMNVNQTNATMWNSDNIDQATNNRVVTP